MCTFSFFISLINPQLTSLYCNFSCGSKKGPEKYFWDTKSGGGANFKNSLHYFVSQKYFAVPFMEPLQKLLYNEVSWRLINGMKNENVHMQALHRKLDVVLVQILRGLILSRNRLQLLQGFAPRRTLPSTWMRVSPSDPFSPHYFFAPLPCR